VAGEVPAMAALTASEGGARLLSFCFYLLAAREFTTAGFGEVRYTIALSVLAFGAAQVLANSLTREVGAARGDRLRTAEVLGSGVLLAVIVLAATIALCLVAAAVGLTQGADTVGLVAAVIGLAGFQLYYGVARGLGGKLRPASTYLGGSLLQLVAFAVVVVVSQPTPRTALLIFGFSSLVPVLMWELVDPVLLRRGLVVGREAVRRLIRLGTPLLFAELAYLVWLSADQIWVQHAFGSSEVGIYSAAKNLIQVLYVIPAGTTAVLMPRVAELRTAEDVRHARRLVAITTAGVVGVCGVIGLAVIAVRAPLLGALYGDAYRAGANSLLILTLGSVANAAFVVLTTSAVGWGRPVVYSTAMGVAAVCELVGLAVLSSDHVTTAAWAVSGSITVALVVVAVWLFARPFSVREGGAGSTA
jgi:O-antigen/teichoic acid export membrane protein